MFFKHPQRPITDRSRVARTAVALVAAAGLALSITSCTAGGGQTETDNAAANSGSADGVTIAVMGGMTSDPFWSIVKAGAEAAAESVRAAGGDVTFVAMPDYKNFNPDAAKLVGNILAQKPSAAVIPDWAPDAQNPNIQALTDADIPVVLYNNGVDQVETVGALSFVGSDNREAGAAAGEQFVEAGAKHALCINIFPGQAIGEMYCGGFKEAVEAGGAMASELGLPSTQYGDPTAITQAIKAALQNDPTIDALHTISAPDATNAAAAVEQAGLTGKILIGGQDYDKAALERITDGSQLFAIDQQGYAQGYYAVSQAFQYAAYGIEMPSMATGPVVIDESNAATVAEAVNQGVR